MNTEDTILNEGTMKEPVSKESLNEETMILKENQTTASGSPEKKKIRINKTAAVAAAVGGGVGSVFASTVTDDSDDEVVVENEAGGDSEIVAEEVVAEPGQELPIVSDDMSFGEAFAAARAAYGPGAVFEWHGNTYNTYFREELEAKGDEDVVAEVDAVDESDEVAADDVQVVGADSDDAIVIDDHETAFVAEVDEVYVDVYDDQFSNTSFEADSYMPDDSIF